jgi:hypothetical protein
MATEIVVGSTRRDLVVTLTDEDGVPINLSGAQSLRLQGISTELPSKIIDVVMALVSSGTDGKVKKTSIGSLISHSDLGSLSQAVFSFRVYFKDSSGLIDYSPLFELLFVHPPIEPV